MKQHQALDREERAAWRDAQKLYAEEKERADEIQMVEIHAEAEEKRWHMRYSRKGNEGR